MKTFLTKMDGVMALGAKPVNDAYVHAHVGEESHASLSLSNFLACQPGCVLEGLLNVFSLQVGIPLENLVEAGPVGDLADDHRHGNAHAADAGASSHDPRVERDPVQQTSHLPFKTRLTVQEPSRQRLLLDTREESLQRDHYLKNQDEGGTAGFLGRYPHCPWGD